MESGIVVLIHGQEGVDVLTQQFAEQIAQYGYRVLIPDWVTTYAVAAAEQPRSPSQVQAALQQVDRRELLDCMKRVLVYADSLLAQEGNLVLMGQGWGGTQAFELATYTHLPEATVVIEGDGPKLVASCARISAPVYGFYDGEETAQLKRVRALAHYMVASGKTFDIEVYPNAEANFMLRAEGQQTLGSRSARRQAYQRLADILANL
jgi:carboxymethylenebutenolidase